MNIDLTNRVYKVDDKVYKGYTPLTVQNQRGRLFIKYRGKQVNIKDIPVLPAGINAKLWAKGDVHNFFVSIGFDQVLHYIQLFITFKYLMQ